MGALRFKRDPGGTFLDSNQELATPPWASIRDLEYASLQIEKDNSAEMTDYGNWLGMLVKPGSSLGGARPKANVVDENGVLWIAKFPSANDEKDTGAWEKVLNELAASSGITVPESEALVFSGNQHTFLTKRFDRSDQHHRIHFASAMTLLGEQDGADYSSGASYLDMAGFICRFSNKVEYNLEELWRRMVFNIAVSNCDDHLRNHGFILKNSGWELSPAYDMNPDETGTGLKLNISENDNSLDFDLAMSVISHFCLSPEKAQSILKEVQKSVSSWRQTAVKYGISRMEQEMVERAFRY
jgi:serine/threonine-protein kinase HipA